VHRAYTRFFFSNQLFAGDTLAWGGCPNRGPVETLHVVYGLNTLLVALPTVAKHEKEPESTVLNGENHPGMPYVYTSSLYTSFLNKMTTM